MAKLVQYTPEHFEAVRRAAEAAGRARSLRHRPFVDHYYAGSAWCSLHLFLDGQGAVLGTIGVERMPFTLGGRELTLGFGSNFHAFQSGAGALLFMQWMKSCPIGIVFGGTAQTHAILRQQKWTYYEGVKVFYLNRPFAAYSGEAPWRRLAKRAFERAARRTVIPSLASRIPRGAAGLAVEELAGYPDGLLPQSSPFALRFAPALDYLRWRYGLGLSFVRYRLFRILRGGASVGYVILNDAPDQLIVAHCDAEDPTALACGVLLSVVEAARDDAAPRTLMAAACHPEVQRVYESVGLSTYPFLLGRVLSGDWPFALGRLRGAVDVPADTSGWLVSFDWGDNGLRAPFLGQEDAP